jgi:hypothetical protein
MQRSFASSLIVDKEAKACNCMRNRAGGEAAGGVVRTSKPNNDRHVQMELGQANDSPAISQRATEVLARPRFNRQGRWREQSYWKSGCRPAVPAVAFVYAEYRICL